MFPALSLDEVHRVAADALSQAHFFTGPGVTLEGPFASAPEVSWEVFRGRLLPASQTRQTKTFQEWNLYLVDETGRSGEPLLSLKLDHAERQLHVVRALLCHVWEAYDSGGNVIQSRETIRWE